MKFAAADVEQPRTRREGSSAVRSELAYLAQVPDAGTVVMVSDGTAAGTRMLADPARTIQLGGATNLRNFGAQLSVAAQTAAGAG